METKKTLVHVIDSLGRGGAESMFVSILPRLNQHYKVVLVTLSGAIDFEENQVECYKRYSLGYKSKLDLPGVVLKLRRIIKEHQPQLVRSQLYWSTIVARLATPSQIPFIFSVHSVMSADAFSSKLLTWLERNTYKKSQHLIAVSNAVLTDYKQTIGIKGPSYVLNNFVAEDFFNRQYQFSKQPGTELKVVAVGNLKRIKNYSFLLNVIKKLHPSMQIKLDIIGDGDLRNELQAYINTQHLPVTLLGKRSNVAELLTAYDIYVMCSLSEGFGNGPVEAMAMGLPLILNDSDTMKEVSKGNAIFFKSNNEDDLVKQFLLLDTQLDLCRKLSEEGKKIAREYYHPQRYFEKLLDIYKNL